MSIVSPEFPEKEVMSRSKRRCGREKELVDPGVLGALYLRRFAVPGRQVRRPGGGLYNRATATLKKRMTDEMATKDGPGNKHASRELAAAVTPPA